MSTSLAGIEGLKGKLAIVTGATGAIGSAIVKYLADDGLHVALLDLDQSKELNLMIVFVCIYVMARLYTNDRDQGKLDAAAAALSDSTGTNARGYQCDVSSKASCSAVCSRIKEDFGRGADVLVNVAGILSNNKLLQCSEEEWRRLHAVNLDSAFFLSQEVVPAMKEKRWGRIVNITSYAWKSGGRTSGTAYSSSKAAMVGLTFTVAKEVAEFGITCNGIAPCYVMSKMVTDQLTEEQRLAQVEAIPVKRFAQPEEVAHAVRFLVSPMSAFITGEILDMNGGFQMD
jgi:3-oxoacyl-[acyl-carrier protein] reductase